MKVRISEIRRMQELADLSQGGVQIDIPENTSYKEFATAVANILKKDYGTHNFKPFIEALVAELKPSH